MQEVETCVEGGEDRTSGGSSKVALEHNYENIITSQEEQIIEFRHCS